MSMVSDLTKTSAMKRGTKKKEAHQCLLTFVGQ